MLGVLAGLAQAVDLGAHVGQVLAELADALIGLGLLLGDDLLAREAVVLVERLGEGGQRGRHVANLGGRRLGGQVGELAAERLALPQGGVVGDVLGGIG